MRLFITGGNGFLGSHILNELKNTNIDYLAPTSKELNILDGNALNHYIMNYQPDSILHLSARCGGILANKNSPADFLRDNTQMALNIYESARLYEIPYVYSLGSVCMYPVNCPIPFKEDDIWNGAAEITNFPYGQAKRTLMMLGQTYRQQYNVGGAHLIPINLFGPKDHFDLVNSHVIPALINKFNHAAINNLPTVECWGSGNACREFVFARDCAQAIVKAITTKLDTNLPINLGVGKDISIKELAKLIAKLTNYKGKVVFTGAVSDGQPKRVLDVSRAKELLDWQASTSLEEGLKETIAWYRQTLKSV